MNRVTAAEMIPKLAQACTLIADSLEILRPNAAADELKSYAARVGQALTAVQWDLMRPIFEEYPDLNPYKHDDQKD